MHLGIVSDWKKPYYKRKMQRMISNRGILIYSSGKGKGIEVRQKKMSTNAFAAKRFHKVLKSSALHSGSWKST